MRMVLEKELGDKEGQLAGLQNDIRLLPHQRHGAGWILQQEMSPYRGGIVGELLCTLAKSQTHEWCADSGRDGLSELGLAPMLKPLIHCQGQDLTNACGCRSLATHYQYSEQETDFDCRAMFDPVGLAKRSGVQALRAALHHVS